MTPAELDDLLDATEAAAAGDPGRRPGLITVQTDDWIERISAMQSCRPQTIVDGIRIRDIKVAVGAQEQTTVLTRDEAGGRGEPYRDLAPRR